MIAVGQVWKSSAGNTWRVLEAVRAGYWRVQLVKCSCKCIAAEPEDNVFVWSESSWGDMKLVS